MMLMLSQSPVFGQEQALAVIYPDVREPYQGVFQEITRGVYARSPRAVKEFVLSQEHNQQTFEEWLAANDIGAIIALGRRGVSVAESVAKAIPVVGGALQLTPESTGVAVAGISLDADPDILFQQLKAMAPNIQRVHVIYDPQTSGWLIDLARVASRRHGLAVDAHPAANLKQSARMYADILGKADPVGSAIWVPVDAVTVDEKVIMPLVLKESWDRSILVFSSNPAHAKKGALFSFYPDNGALGRRLAQMADRRIRERDAVVPGIVPLRDLRIAVNRRTADHLGINITREQLEKYDLVFPAP